VALVFALQMLVDNSAVAVRRYAHPGRLMHDRHIAMRSVGDCQLVVEGDKSFEGRLVLS
jgi:hypothetical protein